MTDVLQPGATFAGPYPFVRVEVDLPPFDPEGTAPNTVASWRPGIEATQGDYDVHEMADGVGKILLTVVSVHRPGSFPSRVFYTRQWQDPDGKVFGKAGCRVTTAQAFRRLARGYRHEFEMRAPASAGQEG